MTELWEQVASTALMGTSRRPFTPPTDATPVGALLGQIHPNDPERALLSAAAVLALHRRAGRTLDTTDLPLPTPCDLNDLPRVSPRAAKHLSSIFMDSKLDVFMPEWLALAAKFGQRVSEEYLPDLLARGAKNVKLRATILQVIGKRGYWLAAQNADWAYVLLTEADWQTASLPQRRIILQQVRQADPARARLLVESTWSNDKAKDRAEFIQSFATHLSLADEPFLEMALDDKAQNVRTQAALLLAQLPQSRLSARMLERVQHYVVPAKTNRIQNALGGAKYQIQMSLPEAFTDDLCRDGLDEKAANVHLPALWLAQIVAAVPLAWWTQTWETTPQRLLALASKLEHGPSALVQGWHLAALRQKNAEWALALLDTDIEERDALVQILPPAQREAVVLRLFKADNTLFMQHPARLLLGECDHAWSADFTRAIIHKLVSDVHNNYNQNFYNTHQNLATYLSHFPLTLTDEIIQTITNAAQTTTLYGHEEFLRLLRFRKSMYEEFNR